MVKLLLSHNAAVNTVTPHRGSALTVAAQGGHVSIVDHLLAAGADPNFSLSPSLAPVACAAYSGQYPAFRALVNAGGSPRVEDYYILFSVGHRSVLMLDDRYFHALQCSALMTMDHRVPRRTALPILKSMTLARRALCFAARTREGKVTIFYNAAVHGFVHSVDLMIRYCAWINMEGGLQGTPLMAACFAGHLPIVKLLVRSGALLSYWNGTSHVSALIKAQHHPKILRWLLVGRFTETLWLTESPTGGELHSESAETLQGNANETSVELILEDAIEGYFEKNFWFVPARRFVDSGDGSFDTVDILPSDFAKFKPTYI